jgi:hypothetical protein
MQLTTSSPGLTMCAQSVQRLGESMLGADESRLASACYRRASRWADAVREGLDPDIARFIRDQAAAWQLIANELAGRGG